MTEILSLIAGILVGGIAREVYRDWKVKKILRRELGPHAEIGNITEHVAAQRLRIKLSDQDFNDLVHGLEIQPKETNVKMILSDISFDRMRNLILEASRK